MAYNSTIINRKKHLSCGHFDYNFSKGRCKSCATIQSAQKRIAEHEEAEEDENLAGLVEDLDAVFSRYIRLKYSDDKGIVKCYTCSKKLPISQIQNGHFVHRTDYETRWMEDNCRPQCEVCNSKHNDDPSIFRELLEKEKSGITAWILEQSRLVAKPTRSELKELLIIYRNKVKLLEKKITKK